MGISIFGTVWVYFSLGFFLPGLSQRLDQDDTEKPIFSAEVLGSVSSRKCSLFK